MRFCSDIWNMRDSALSNRSNLKFEYLNKIDTKCKSMLINLLVTPLGGLVWWEKKVLWHWVVLFCLLNIHETSPYFIYSVRCYLLVGIAYWNAKKSIRKCTHVLYCTVRNVWADFVVRDWWRFLQSSMWRKVSSNRGNWSKILSHSAKQKRHQLNFLTVIGRWFFYFVMLT